LPEVGGVVNKGVQPTIVLPHSEPLSEGKKQS